MHLFINADIAVDTLMLKSTMIKFSLRRKRQEECT